MKRIALGILLVMLACALAMPALATTTDNTPYLTAAGSVTVAVGKTASTNLSTNASNLEFMNNGSHIASISGDGKTITGVGVGSTTIAIRATFDIIDSDPIIKEIHVTVTEATPENPPPEQPKTPKQRFTLSRTTHDKLRANADPDAPIGFADADLNIRDDDNMIVGVLPAGELAAVRQIGDERVDIITADGIAGSVAYNGFIPIGTVEGVAVVNQENAILRLGAGADTGFADRAAQGETLPVVTTDGNWALVMKGKNVHYISNKNITLVGMNVDGKKSGITLLSETLTLKVGEEAEIQYKLNDPAAVYQGLKEDWQYVNTQVANGKVGNRGVAVGKNVGTTYAYGTDYEDKVQLVVIQVVSADADATPIADIPDLAGQAADDGTKYVVTASRLNVRAGAATTFSKLTKIDRNTVAYGEEVEGTAWIYITKCDSNTAAVGGYVAGKYLAEAE